MAISAANLGKYLFTGHNIDIKPFWAARADILRRAGNRKEAAKAYRRALELTQNAAELSFLERRLAHVLSDDVRL